MMETSAGKELGQKVLTLPRCRLTSLPPERSSKFCLNVEDLNGCWKTTFEMLVAVLPGIFVGNLPLPYDSKD